MVGLEFLSFWPTANHTMKNWELQMLECPCDWLRTELSSKHIVTDNHYFWFTIEVGIVVVGFDRVLIRYWFSKRRLQLNSKIVVPIMGSRAILYCVVTEEEEEEEQ